MKLLLFFLAAMLSSEASAQSYLLPSQRAFTSRDAALETELLIRQQQISNEADLKYSWNWCQDSSNDLLNPICTFQRSISYSDSISSFQFSPIIEQSYRQEQSLDNQTHATYYGGILQGHVNYLSFWVDARIHSESHSKHDGLNRADLSWDREFIDVQTEDRQGSSNNVSFVSYARYRANMTLHTQVGKLGFKRETVHWGPGVYTNLVFNHHALPFNHVFYEAEIGPLRVWTLWGRLSRSQGGVYQQGDEHKSVYAHRYEWSVFSNLTLGMTEQMILFNQEEPWAFVPIVPLFMEKGQGVERANNGNLAFDFSYRQPGIGLIYSEFLIDDLQEPSTLFDDFWGNRWAWMAGLHLSPSQMPQLGLITEYSRVEPWVYTHYTPLTSQASNGGSPLGNPYGPNSQVVIVQPYYSQLAQGNPSSKDLSWSLGLKAQWLWQGDDIGSHIHDGAEDRRLAEQQGLVESDKKRFIHDVDAEFSLGPVIKLRYWGLQMDIEADYFGLNDELLVRLAYQY